MWDKKWEYPGGKIENGEEPISAVRREILEETGLSVEGIEFLGIHQHDWQLPDEILRVHLHCFVSIASSDRVTIEPDAAYGFEWVSPAEIDQWDLLEPNARFTKLLLWPRLSLA